MRYLERLAVQNFLSLRQVDLELGKLNVLVGPNAAGKTNLLKVLQFLGDTVRLDLGPAIEIHGGRDRLFFNGAGPKNLSSAIRIELRAQLTKHASTSAPDEYSLSFWSPRPGLVQRYESFTFKRRPGRGRRITVRGARVEIADDLGSSRRRVLATSSAGLSTLARLGEEEGAEQVRELGALFETFRIFEVDVAAARRPSALDEAPVLAADARNLARFLVHLYRQHPAVFRALEEDLMAIVPGVKALHVLPIGGAGRGVAVSLEERGLRKPTDLAAASYGTVRALSLLALLHDPDPSMLTCVEEIDHGLHPYALDTIVDRLREASQRTQILVATHSPALVNRLDSSELIVCERDPETGASRIPAIDPQVVRNMEGETRDELRLGELWFSGALGGVP